MGWFARCLSAVGRAEGSLGKVPGCPQRSPNPCFGCGHWLCMGPRQAPPHPPPATEVLIPVRGTTGVPMAAQPGNVGEDNDSKGLFSSIPTSFSLSSLHFVTLRNVKHLSRYIDT